jgi:hypothetical protein
MTRRIGMTAVALAVGAGLLTASVAAPAMADEELGDAFGQHVPACAQTMGFDADHNPGMHQGYAGWTPDHTC